MRALRSFCHTALCLAALAPAASAFAGSPDYSQFLSGPDMEWTKQFAEGWQVSVGGGVLVKPEFMGSQTYEILPVPLIDAHWGDRLTINTRDGVSYDVLKGEDYRLGAGLGYDFGRSEDAGKDNWLRGMGDVDPTIEARLYGDYGFQPIWIEAELDADALSNGHKGWTGTVGAKYRQTSGEHLAVSVGPSLTWASDDYMDSYFGVTDRQAAASRFSTYNPSAGIRDYALDGSAVYSFGSDGKWFATGFGKVSRLLGDAGGSPVVQDEVQVTAGAGIGYKF